MATKRLIDANTLKSQKTILWDEALGFCDCVLVENIDDAKTVDAVEVVHGQWEDIYGGKYANPRYRCSVCKEKALFKFEKGVIGGYIESQALTPFCPYCMAKLDGGKANDI